MPRVFNWRIVVGVLILEQYSLGCELGNSTLSPGQRQLCEFSEKHPRPRVLSTTAGRAVDLRETITINSEMFSNEFIADTMLHFDRERIPERVVHAKGTAALGYFQVTHDVSKYTKADVFNGIGKKTPVTVRLSTATHGIGGPDVSMDQKGMAIKFYTKEGNLDLLCLQTPVYIYRDPLLFNANFHAFKRNPATNVFDATSRWDFFTLQPHALHSTLWLQSGYGTPTSYRNMDAFPIHTYELNNKKGETYYVRFNFRTEQGLSILTPEQVLVVSRDLDYYTRDLYNNIANHTYPSWRLEMNVLTLDDIKHIDFDPHDVTRQWKNGTYHTVEIGRLVLNKNPDNFFRVSEISAFSPSSLVPGILSPLDFLFKGRRIFYRDTQNYRVGINHMKAEVNMPLYAKTYTRDGVLPVRENMRDTPNYFPNSFHGPAPVVDSSWPSRRLRVIESNAVDLGPPANFYNHVLENDAQRQLLANNLAVSIVSVTEPTKERGLEILTLIDKDLGNRVRAALKKLSPGDVFM